MTGERDGWQADVEALHKMFLYLDIHVEYYYDLSANELISELDHFAGSPDNGSTDCLFVVMMGHGGLSKDNKEYLMTSDRHAFFLREGFSQIFNNNSHEKLMDKPKVFLVQMCRGHVEEKCVMVQGNKGKTPCDATPTGYNITTATRKTIPFSDYMIAFASQPGHKAYRHTERGTLFIQELCDVFVKNAAHKQVADMLKEVNRRLEQYKESQVGEYMCSMNALLYLLPGLHRRVVRAHRQDPQLKVSIDWVGEYGGLPSGLLGNQEGCLVTSMYRAVLLDGDGKRLCDYQAAERFSIVKDMCKFEDVLFLIHEKSITVRENALFKRRASSPVSSRTETSKQAMKIKRVPSLPSFSSPGVQRRGAEEGNTSKIKRHEVCGRQALHSAVATGRECLVLLDRGKSEVVEYKLGDFPRILLRGVNGRSLCKHIQDGELRFLISDDSDHCVKVYNERWKHIHTIGELGIGDGQLSYPCDAVVTDENTIIVADWGNNRVSEFSFHGMFIRHILSEKNFKEKPRCLSFQHPFLWIATDSDKVLKYELY